MLQSRAAIQAEIDKVLTRSARLTEAAKTRARANIEKAFSGSGFGDAQMRALIKTIGPANTGFTRGGIADGIQNLRSLSEEDLDTPPDPPKDMDDYFGEPDPDDAVTHFEVPGGTQGAYAGAPEPQGGSAFSQAIADQYPLTSFNIEKPALSPSLEQRFMQGQGPKYLPTSGPPFLGDPNMGPGKESKARTTMLQKSAADTRLAKLDRLQKLVTLLACYAYGDDAAGRKLGIR